MKDPFTRCIFAFIHNDLKCAWVPICYCAKTGSIVDDVKTFIRIYGKDNLRIRLIHDSEIEIYNEFYSEFFED